MAGVRFVAGVRYVNNQFRFANTDAQRKNLYYNVVL